MKVFENAPIGTISLRNRTIRSATREGLADDQGYPGEALTRLYTRLAKGELGAIITGFATVH